MNLKTLMRVFQQKQLLHNPLLRRLSSMPEEQSSPFFKRFKVEKEVLFDSILDMSDKQVQQQCAKFDLPVVDAKIHNIQRLINYYNKVEKEMLMKEQLSGPSTAQKMDDGPEEVVSKPLAGDQKFSEVMMEGESADFGASGRRQRVKGRVKQAAFAMQVAGELDLTSLLGRPAVPMR